MREKWIRRALMLCTPAALLSASPAWGAFSRLTCPTSGWGTPIPTEMGGLEYVRQSTSPAGGTGDMTLYNLSQTGDFWGVMGNGNIRFLNPWFGFFVTETNFDKFAVTVGGSNFTYTGALNSSTTTLVQSGDTWDLRTDLGPAGRANIRWISDVSVANQTPPTIAQMGPRCRTNQTTNGVNGFIFSLQTRMDVLLLGTGDTVYGRITQPANQAIIISMDLLNATAGADFDLYASTTTSLPDDSNFQWRGFSGFASEALFIPAAATSRTVNIGIHSFNGSGDVALDIAAPQINNPRFCITDAGLTNHVTLNATQQGQLRDHFQAGSAHLYSYSNGMLFRQTFTNNTTWSGSCTTTNGCDICIVNDAPNNVSFGSGVAGFPCGHIDMHGGNWQAGIATGWLFAHESGHACFGLPDQYQLPPAGDSSPRYCGHTTMANNSKSQTFCSQNHCRDGQVFDSGQCDPNGQSDWARMLGTTWATGYAGTRFSDTNPVVLTANPAPIYNNPNFRGLVSVNF